jgi:trimeric autotransporter adhesin
MQTKELYRATIRRVANTTDMSGTGTAEEFNRGLRTGKERSLGGITDLPALGSLMATSIFVALALMTARTNAGILDDIATLKAEVAELHSIPTLKAQVAALQTQVDKLQTQLTAVQSNNALKLGPFVSVVSGLVNGVNGPHIFFTGANIHIVSGSTTTADSVTGLGNLIIGYNEIPGGLSPGERGGAHNLVIGRNHRFTSAASGGLVAGERNRIESIGASVSGGGGNIASGVDASVSGGNGNRASADLASVSGGQSNVASGNFASVSGGNDNVASGEWASVSGGNFNFATSGWSSVSGGASNQARGDTCSISGGSDNIADGRFASVSGGHNNFINAFWASILGGHSNFASGASASITGGDSNTASGDFSVVLGGHAVNSIGLISPQPPFP